MFGFLPVPFTGVSEENDGTSDGKGAAVVSGNEVVGGGGRTGSTVLEGISVGTSVGISVGISVDGGSVGSGCEVAPAVSLGTGSGTVGAAVAPSPSPSPVGAGAAGAAVAPAPSLLSVMAVLAV